MWTAASTTAVLALTFTNVGTMLGYFIGTVVSCLVALLGLSFSVRSVATWIYNQEVNYGLNHHFGAVPWAGYNRFRSKKWNLEHTA